MGSHGLHRPVSGSMRQMTRVLSLQRSAYLASSSCASGERTSLEHERDPSVSVNLHVLEALVAIPAQDRTRVRDKILRYVLGARHYDAFWTAKWHVRPTIHEQGAHCPALPRARRCGNDGGLASCHAARQRCLGTIRTHGGGDRAYPPCAAQVPS